MAINENRFTIDTQFRQSTEWFLSNFEELKKLSGIDFKTQSINPSVVVANPNNGSIKFINLHEGLSLLIADCRLLNTIVLNYLPTSNYNDSFFHFSVTLDNTYIGVDSGNEISFGNDFSKAIFYSSFQKNFSIRYPAHKNVKFINIYASKQWVEDNLLPYFKIDNQLSKSIIAGDPFQKIYNINLKCYDVVNEIISSPVTESYHLLYLIGRVLTLLSSFCQSIDNTVSRNDLRFIEDAQSITQKIDELLLDFSNPWPPINVLAQSCQMSKTKFESIFKKKYGTSYYAFYTNARMAKAYDSILNNNVPVAEVAWDVGFSNAGYFAKLFKQYFGVLPKSLKSI